MIMCFPIEKKDTEKESLRENLDALLICIEKGEKKLCKLFKKTKKDDNNKRSDRDIR